VDKLYKPYDIGQIGQLDLHILAELYGGDDAARDLTPAWNGGIYWAGQQLSAKTPAQRASTSSIALFYLSDWKNEASARNFAAIYSKELGHKYSGLKRDVAAETSAPSTNPAGQTEQIYSTAEGPVVITTRGKLVFVAESFDLPLARKLAALVLDGQGSGELKMAGLATPSRDSQGRDSQTLEPLTSGLVRLFSNCGVMKAAVEAGVRSSVPAK
jgi:hypothetical protein